MGKLRLALLIPSNHLRGPNIFTKNLVLGLINRDIFVTVFYFKSYGNDVVDFGCLSRKVSFFDTSWVGGFDIIHSTQAIPDLYLAVHGSKISCVKIASMHNEIGEDLKRLYPKLKADLIFRVWKMALDRIDNIIVSSSSQMSYYKKILKSDINFSTIPYGIPPAEVKVIFNSHRDTLEYFRSEYRVVGACGLYIERKGFDQLIRVLSHRKDLALVLVGDGPLRRDLESLAEKEGVIDRVLFTGFTKDYLSYFPYFDMYAMVSYSEGFGLAMLEALSLSIPLLCSDLAIYEEYFDDNSVVRFKKGDLNGLIKGFEVISANISKYSLASGKLFADFFSLDQMADMHESFYKKLLLEKK